MRRGTATVRCGRSHAAPRLRWRKVNRSPPPLRKIARSLPVRSAGGVLSRGPRVRIPFLRQRVSCEPELLSLVDAAHILAFVAEIDPTGL
jgi:hypothetical protein